MWQLDHKEGWVPKNWCFWTVVLEKTLESPLDSKEIKPVNPKGNQLWIFTGKTDAEAPILWPPDSRGRLIGKDPDAGKDWEQEKTGATEDEMIGWYHRLNGHGFEQTPGDSEGQGSLVCYSPRDCKESDTTSWLNRVILKRKIVSIAHLCRYQTLVLFIVFEILLFTCELNWILNSTSFLQ